LEELLYKTIDDLMGMNNKQLDKLKGVGSTTVSEIIGLVEEVLWPSFNYPRKPNHQKKKKAAKEASLSKAPNTLWHDGAGK
jgi:hypothetical protein